MRLTVLCESILIAQRRQLHAYADASLHHAVFDALAVVNNQNENPATTEARGLVVTRSKKKSTN